LQGFLLDSAGNVAIGKLPLQTAGVNMEKFLVDAGLYSSQSGHFYQRNKCRRIFEIVTCS
jgi:hypothetical protein